MRADAPVLSEDLFWDPFASEREIDLSLGLWQEAVGLNKRRRIGSSDGVVGGGKAVMSGAFQRKQRWDSLDSSRASGSGFGLESVRESSISSCGGGQEYNNLQKGTTVIHNDDDVRSSERIAYRPYELPLALPRLYRSTTSSTTVVPATHLSGPEENAIVSVPVKALTNAQAGTGKMKRTRKGKSLPGPKTKITFQKDGVPSKEQLLQVSQIDMLLIPGRGLTS